MPWESDFLPLGVRLLCEKAEVITLLEHYQTTAAAWATQVPDNDRRLRKDLDAFVILLTKEISFLAPLCPKDAMKFRDFIKTKMPMLSSEWGRLNEETREVTGGLVACAPSSKKARATSKRDNASNASSSDRSSDRSGSDQEASVAPVGPSSAPIRCWNRSSGTKVLLPSWRRHEHF